MTDGDVPDCWYCGGDGRHSKKVKCPICDGTGVLGDE